MLSGLSRGIICMPAIVLATQSHYKRALFTRLGIPFIAEAADVDESPQPGEPPLALAERLAEAKARALADRHPDALLIGCDQVAVVDGHLLGKPGTPEKAREQLRLASGRRMEFHTSVAMLNARTGRLQRFTEPVAVDFRPLDEATIADYIAREQPMECAGSFRSEQLGIALFTGIHTRDPNALVGLPLIALVDMLLAEGIPLFNRGSEL